MPDQQIQTPFQPQESKRVSPTPKNELDFQMMNTDPAWGQEFIPDELKKKLTTQEIEVSKTIELIKIDINQIELIKIQLKNQGYEEAEKDTFILKLKSEWIVINIDVTTGVMTKTTYLKVITEDTMWAIHGYYTRDLRLGNLKDNLNPFARNEVGYCEYHLNLAGDLLNYRHPQLKNGFYKAFFAHIRRVASLLELSQSRNGWFRKTGTTIRNEFESNMPKDQTLEEKRFMGFAVGGKKQP